MSNITIAYFSQKPLLIQQAKANNGVAQEIRVSASNELQRCIDRYEKEFMVLLLGSELYAEYKSDMANAETTLKWEQFNANLFDTELLISPVANYIYFNYLADNEQNYSNNHFTTAKIDGAYKMSLGQQQSIAWNDMVDMLETFLQWLSENGSSIETTAELDYSKWGILLDKKQPYFL